MAGKLNVDRELRVRTLNLMRKLSKMSIQEIRDIQCKQVAKMERENTPEKARKYCNSIYEAVIEGKQGKPGGKAI